MRKIIFLFIFNFLFATHLINVDSEYLKEHQNNLIDWYPWGQEAFKKAKKENKLIFLSIGYSTCHWCHVMLKESFNDKKVASILNKYYVSIKVDKEEHPEIDRFYEEIYENIYHHSLGWPKTIILLPNKKIIFITGYIPKNDLFKKKGLISVLTYYAKLWQKNPKKLLNSTLKIKPKKEIQNKNLLASLKKEILKNYDYKNGGFKGMHKFPEFNKFDLMLDIYLLTKDKKFLSMLNQTLTNIALSGMYDQIEGGFFRYTVFDDFSIPHFEKMLYTNALMIQIYSRAYKYTKNPLFKKVVIETINEFDKHYKSKSGLYDAASSADSPKEGDYFVFSSEEIKKALRGIPNKKEILKYINFDEEGNFEENKNHIYFYPNKTPPKNLQKFLNNLKKIRKTHKFPFIDKKKVLSYNAMMVKALFFASEFNPEYKQKAVNLLNAIYKNFKINKIWYHSFVKKKSIKANLEDFAYLKDALITAYEYTFDKKYLIKAKKIDLFKYKFFIINEKSYPSGVSVAFNALLNEASLENNLTLFFKIKNMLNSYPASLNTAYLSKAKLKAKFLEYVIKYKNPNIYETFYYPYVLWKKLDLKNYEVCNILSCKLSTKDTNEIKKFFKKLKY